MFCISHPVKTHTGEYYQGENRFPHTVSMKRLGVTLSSPVYSWGPKRQELLSTPLSSGSYLQSLIRQFQQQVHGRRSKSYPRVSLAAHSGVKVFCLCLSGCTPRWRLHVQDVKHADTDERYLYQLHPWCGKLGVWNGGGMGLTMVPCRK